MGSTAGGKVIDHGGAEKIAIAPAFRALTIQPIGGTFITGVSP
jgi:hypothetical protein